MAKTPQVFPSIMRIAATLSIFVFHFLGLINHYQYQLDIYAIIIFSFLSGYLGKPGKNRTEWLKKRYIKIMIPYWIVIIPVIIATSISGYKPITFYRVIGAIFGFNMFITNPIYVISWYITFILLLYLYAFIESLYNEFYYIIICMISGLVVFGYFFHESYYFIAFFLGIRFSGFYIEGIGSSSKISKKLFVVQKYCYAFFLIHGAVLFSFIRYIFIRHNDIPSILIFCVSFVLSGGLSVILYYVSSPIQTWLANQTLLRAGAVEKGLPP